MAGSVAALLMFALPSVGAEQSFSPWVDDRGSIRFPDEFRESMVHIGSWFVPEGGASGFHDVFTERESLEAYRRTGLFPDGATLVKELRAADAGSFTTGQNVSYANTEIKQWFVMIKDETGRFPDNAIWGEGWGWALFKADAPTINVATDFRTDCLGCHVPARAADWIYVEGYPALQTE